MLLVPTFGRHGACVEHMLGACVRSAHVYIRTRFMGLLPYLNTLIHIHTPTLLDCVQVLTSMLSCGPVCTCWPWPNLVLLLKIAVPTLTYPAPLNLDTLPHFPLPRHLLHTEGFQALFKGLAPSLFGIIPTRWELYPLITSGNLSFSWNCTVPSL